MLTTVQVEEGVIRGVETESTLNGKPVYSFSSIPYAKPPIGDLRFRAPVPVEKWDGVLEATKREIICTQIDKSRFGTSEPDGTEDCLYLNVYTPEAPCKIEEKRPVMVYIHGGGFCQGTASTIGPSFLLEHDVILVTFNYRLHVLGFLNAGTVNCPGNAGLKDQLLALKWVKRNIGSFGGDADNITVFGESAGAVSVHLHVLSPASRGLFHRAIMQSGTALSPWAIEKDPVQYARVLGLRAGYIGNDDLEELAEYLKKQSAARLTELAEQIHMEDRLNNPARCANVRLIPSVEVIEEGAFLAHHPSELMNTAVPIPTIVGFNDQEGLLYYLAQELNHMDQVLDNPAMILQQNFNLDEFEQVDLLTNMNRFYFRNEKVTKDNLADVVNLYGDLYFLKFYEAIDHMIQSEIPPFVYVFAYEGHFNLFKREYFKKYVNVDIKGSAHADELAYILDYGLPIHEDDKKLVREFGTLWTNFAKNGEPTSTLPHVRWKPHTNSNPYHLKIDGKLEVFGEKLFAERFDFWKRWTSKFFR